MFSKVIKILSKIIILLMLFIIVYFSMEFILSRITNKYITKGELNYELFIKSNGAHTDIVFPVRSNVIDWTKLFNTNNTKSKRDNFKYVAIGWGDKGFYLDTPTWAELKVSTALKAAFGIGGTALHITYYDEIFEDNLTYKIKVTKEQYSLLVQRIKESLQYKNSLPINIETNALYGENDSFYEAIGRYSIFHTCNTWTNNTLKYANMPSGVWTAFDKGILYQYKKYKKDINKKE